MKQIQSFFIQFTILLLLAFTSVAGAPFSLFTIAATGSNEVISIESSLDNIDDIAPHNNLDGSDDDTNTASSISSPPSLAFYPLSTITGQTNSWSLGKSIPFYILYQSLIFYHSVA